MLKHSWRHQHFILVDSTIIKIGFIEPTDGRVEYLEKITGELQELQERCLGISFLTKDANLALW